MTKDDLMMKLGEVPLSCFTIDLNAGRIDGYHDTIGEIHICAYDRYAFVNTPNDEVIEFDPIELTTMGIFLK